MAWVFSTKSCPQKNVSQAKLACSVPIKKACNATEQLSFLQRISSIKIQRDRIQRDASIYGTVRVGAQMSGAFHCPQNNVSLLSRRAFRAFHVDAIPLSIPTHPASRGAPTISRLLLLAAFVLHGTFDELEAVAVALPAIVVRRPLFFRFLTRRVVPFAVAATATFVIILLFLLLGFGVFCFAVFAAGAPVLVLVDGPEGFDEAHVLGQVGQQPEVVPAQRAGPDDHKQHLTKECEGDDNA